MEPMNYDVVDFETEVLERSRAIPVLVDFWAEWCGPCRVLGPVLERLAEKQAGSWELKKVDTDAMQDVAIRYGIRSIPAVKLFVDGEVADEFVGAMPESAVERWLQAALPDAHASAVDTAEALLLSGRTEDALRMLGEVLRAAPGHEKARALTASATVFTDPARALALVEDIVGGENGEKADAVRTIAEFLASANRADALPDASARAPFERAMSDLAAQRFDDALAGFIAVIRTDRYYADDASRKACIALFKYLGEEHPITRKWRREFDRALY